MSREAKLIVNLTRGGVVCDRGAIVDGVLPRMRGLLGLRTLGVIDVDPGADVDAETKRGGYRHADRGPQCGLLSRRAVKVLVAAALTALVLPHLSSSSWRLALSALIILIVPQLAGLES